MPYLVGTDEAGYGPNFGPLVISASVWHVESLNQTDLYGQLRDAVRTPREKDNENDVVIGDSKELYKPGKGLLGLEQGVFTCLAAVKKKPRTWKKIWRDVARVDEPSITKLPWYLNFDAKLPLDLPAGAIRASSERLLTVCQVARCVPTQIESRVICAPKFNELCDQFGNKASALSQTTLQLVSSVLQRIPDDEPVHILCDKHGGRNKYGPLLNEMFPDTLAMVREEGRAQSVYHLGTGPRRREFVFRAKADQGFLPSALASMVSKYLRELAMLAFNDYWRALVDDLRPTAGYPTDAKRFKQQIKPMQAKLGIDDRDLWRSR